MSARLLTVWDALRSSFWFLPTVMALGAVALSSATLALDETLETDSLNGLWWIYAGGPEGARSMLGVVAGSMMTVAGTTFSITIAALTLASSQFGPRLLRNFMRDRGNQAVLGVFLATFLYCLLVLRTVRGTDESRIVPHLSITVGLALAVIGVGAVIYFVHHIASSIQAGQVVANVSRELDHAIRDLYPRQLGSGDENRDSAEGLPEDFERVARTVEAAVSGYLQAIDNRALERLATERDVVVRLDVRPGDFVVDGAPVGAVWPPDRVDAELVERLNAALVIGAQRTQAQDVEYGVNQLVEIAVRALSPGVNDPFTAVTCVDRLSEALSHLARERSPSAYRYDDAGRLRVVAHPYHFPGVVRAAFDQIRQYGRSSAAVTIRLLEAIAVVAREVRHDEDRRELRRQAGMIERGAHDGLPEPEDRADVRERYVMALRALDGQRRAAGAEEPASSAPAGTGPEASGSSPGSG